MYIYIENCVHILTVSPSPIQGMEGRLSQIMEPAWTISPALIKPASGRPSVADTPKPVMKVRLNPVEETRRMINERQIL